MRIMSSTITSLYSVLSLSIIGIVSCTTPTDIFILAGQSNMAGRGGVEHGRWDGVVPPECSPDNRVLRLSAKGEWEEAREPLHADIDVNKTCGVGPGMPFAHGVLRGSGADVATLGLVPCAVGGTRIEEWGKGTALYGEMVERAAAALKSSGGGTIRAVLWYQGESDTVKLSDAEAYKVNMEKLVTDLRSDLNLPNLLVIQVALGSGEGKYTEEVRKGQLGISMSNVKCVDAMGLGLKYDKIHLTTNSQIQLGHMLAHSFLAS